MSLRDLAANATPGPWEATRNEHCPAFVNVYAAPARKYGISGLMAPVVTPADGGLMALAPEMAVLLADMADTLGRDWSERGCKDPDCPCSAGKVSALLARFLELDGKADAAAQA